MPLQALSTPHSNPHYLSHTTSRARTPSGSVGGTGNVPHTKKQFTVHRHGDPTTSLNCSPSPRSPESDWPHPSPKLASYYFIEGASGRCQEVHSLWGRGGHRERPPYKKNNSQCTVTMTRPQFPAHSPPAEKRAPASPDPTSHDPILPLSHNQ